MKGNKDVVAQLNDALSGELTAINQYMIHSGMCEHWGYHRLSARGRKQAIDEMKHAKALIERILFLDGTPSMRPVEITVGQEVRAQFQNDLALETGAVASYNSAIRVAREAGDDASRALFTRLLEDEEAHVNWFEAQLRLVEEVGYGQYLAEQMSED